jgi:hypothetical protein
MYCWSHQFFDIIISIFMHYQSDNSPLVVWSGAKEETNRITWRALSRQSRPLPVTRVTGEKTLLEAAT